MQKQKRDFQPLTRRNMMNFRGQPNYQRKKNMHLRPEYPIQFINRTNRASSAPLNRGSSREELLARNISVPNQRYLPYFQPPHKMIPGVSRFMSEHAFAFYTQHKHEYERKWQARKKNANNRGNYEDGVFFSQKPTITNCCICHNLKGNISNFNKHIRSEGHQINLGSPLVQISYNNLITFASTAFMRRFENYHRLQESFGAILPLFKQNYYLSYTKDIDDLPLLEYKAKSKSPDVKRYKKQMVEFEKHAQSIKAIGTSGSHQRTKYSSNATDKTEEKPKIPGSKLTEFKTPHNSNYRCKDYAGLEYTRRDIERVGDQEIGRETQFISRWYNKRDFAWDLMYHLARQNKNICKEVLKEMPEEEKKIEPEPQNEQSELEEILVNFQSQHPRKSQVLQKVDNNISPKRINPGNKRLAAAPKNPVSSQKSLVSLIQMVEEIEKRQQQVQNQYKRKKRSEKSIKKKGFQSQWNSQLAEILSGEYKCGDENVFSLDGKSTEQKKQLKRDGKLRTKTLRKKVK